MADYGMYHANGTPFTIEDLEAWARLRRDKFLTIHVDPMNPIRWEAMPTEKKDEWVAYRQALLDIPQQAGFPENIVWPTKPE